MLVKSDFNVDAVDAAPADVKGKLIDTGSVVAKFVMYAVPVVGVILIKSEPDVSANLSTVVGSTVVEQVRRLVRPMRTRPSIRPLISWSLRTMCSPGLGLCSWLLVVSAVGTLR